MPKKQKTISAREYADLAGITTASVSYRITNKRNLPGIKSYSYDENTRTYKFVRDMRLPDADIKNFFRQK